MKLTSFFAAAALAISAVAASAVTTPNAANTLVDGGVYALEALESYDYQAEISGVDTVSFGFTTVFGQADSRVVTLELPDNSITDLRVEWTTEADFGGSLIADLTPLIANFGFSQGVSTVVTIPVPGPSYLSVSWDAGTKLQQVNIQVAGVPVPAGALLLGTALVGFFAARRRA